MTQPIRILIADDHYIVRQGLSQICDAEPDMEVVGTAADGQEAYTMALRLQPDIVIMDINMPVLNGVEATKQITAALPSVGIVILTMYQQETYGLEAVKAGARAYLLKDADGDILLQAIHAVAAGESVLTPIIATKILDSFYEQQREPVVSNGIIFLNKWDLELLQLFAQGLDISTVSQRRHVSEAMVRDRIAVIFEKVHVCHNTPYSPYALH